MEKENLQKMIGVARNYRFSTTGLASYMGVRSGTSPLLSLGLISFETEELWKELELLIDRGHDSNHCLGCNCINKDARKIKIEIFFKKLDFSFDELAKTFLPWRDECALYNSTLIDGIFRQLKGEDVVFLTFLRRNQVKILKKEVEIKRIDKEIRDTREKLKLLKKERNFI